jgi:hypothetical protein
VSYQQRRNFVQNVDDLVLSGQKLEFANKKLHTSRAAFRLASWVGGGSDGILFAVSPDTRRCSFSNRWRVGVGRFVGVTLVEVTRPSLRYTRVGVVARPGYLRMSLVGPHPAIHSRMIM